MRLPLLLLWSSLHLAVRPPTGAAEPWDGDDSAFRTAARESPRNRARQDGPGQVAFVDVEVARRTRVVRSARVLGAEEVARVLDVVAAVQSGCPDQRFFNNPQNAQHAQAHKACTFLSQPGAGDLHNPFAQLAPKVLQKLLDFADAAWRGEDWSRPGGALAAFAGPPGSMCDLFCGGGARGLQVATPSNEHSDRFCTGIPHCFGCRSRPLKGSPVC